MKVAVYTAIFGGKDEYIGLAAGPDAYLFTDCPVSTSRARVVLDRVGGDPRRRARLYKLLPHVFIEGPYDAWVWLDGSMDASQINVGALAERILSDCDVAVTRHHERSCLYQEAEEVIRLKRDTADVVRNQALRYRKEGCPENLGLGATGILFRRNTETVRKMNDLWYRELDLGSVRDQVSFTYALWKTGLSAKYISWPPESHGIHMKRHLVYDRA